MSERISMKNSNSLADKVGKLLVAEDKPVKAKYCILCLSKLTANKRAKNVMHTPFIKCRVCQSTMFLGHDAAVVGYEVLHSLILKNPKYFRDLYAKRMSKRASAIEEEQENERLGI